MPRPSYSHSSSWSLALSPFVRSSPVSRQRSKLFIPGPPLRQSLEAFVRTSYGHRVCSKHFTPPKRQHSLCLSCAELGFPPLLCLESIAPLSTPADLSPANTGPLRSAPVLSGPAEPLLLFVESTATPTTPALSRPLR